MPHVAGVVYRAWSSRRTQGSARGQHIIFLPRRPLFVEDSPYPPLSDASLQPAAYLLLRKIGHKGDQLGVVQNGDVR
jgi:hypothetical protein